MRFSVTRTSVVGSFIVGIAVVTLFETPVLHLALHRARWPTHLVVLALNVYTLYWLWQQRRRLRDAAHTLDDAGLHLALPGRWQGTIACDAIASVRHIDPPPPGAPRPRGVLRITPIDSPNVELVTHGPATLRGSFGLSRSARRLQLFVDEPDAFVAAVQARITPPAGTAGGTADETARRA
jgi:hypothetical protein